jgi:hypothetical protein
MKKLVVFSFILVLLSVLAILFITDSNDHKECSHIQETKTSNNGTVIVTTDKHVCKEKFNL